jgi:hypothetical protein
MRFSIRDLLWATVVAAMGLGWWAHQQRLQRVIAELETASYPSKMGAGWWINYRSIDDERLAAVEQATRLRATLEAAQRSHKHLSDLVQQVAPADAAKFAVDWSILDEPPVQP